MAARKKAAKKAAKTAGKAGPRKRPAGAGASYRWKTKDFCDALRRSRCVTKACASIGIGLQTAYDRRGKDEKFAKQWADAKSFVNQELVGSAMSRAIEGWMEPKFHDGKKCGEVRKFSDALTIFLLKTRMPDKFSERYLFTKLLQEGAGADPFTLARQLELLAKEMRESVELPPHTGEKTHDDGMA